MVDEKSPIPVVYGEVQDGLVFIHRGRAHDLVQLHEALRDAKTWGEFDAKAPTHWYQDAVERLEEQMLDEFEEPTAEKKFDAEEVPGYADGDWPGFPHMTMEHWVPAEVQDFGSMVPTAISGDFLHLPPEEEEEIVSAMREHGYDCVRDDDLVWEASGYG